VFVERGGGTGVNRIDEQTYPTRPLFLTRQELAANPGSHLDLWDLLMIDERHRIALETLRKSGSPQI
jgi:hypothetical protein